MRPGVLHFKLVMLCLLASIMQPVQQSGRQESTVPALEAGGQGPTNTAQQSGRQGPTKTAQQSGTQRPPTRKPHARQPEHAGYNPRNQEWGRIISLDGTWEIAEGIKTQIPARFAAHVPVPGLVTSARPAFQHVGVVNTLREVFWYRKKFSVEGALPALSRLKIFKCMFGAKVFLNGREVGETAINFAPVYFDVTPFLKGNGEENELIVRVGASIASAPDSVVTGGDPERNRYPPGIYDHVQLLLSDDTYVLRTQVVPHVQEKSITVAIDLASQDEKPRELDLNASIYDIATGNRVATASIRAGKVERSRKTNASATIPIPNAKLWTPASPNLYELRLTDGKYSYSTRFGLREFRVDSAYTNRAYLNGKPAFIRGTNFSIHRFFEDSLSKQHPWDPTWVRQLFRKFTKMEMNGVRFVIGPAPELWYDIADEEGMMIFDEYAVWYAYQPAVGSVAAEAADPYKKWSIWPKNLRTAQLIREYTAWMQERWNHPSVIVWDAQNETWAFETGEAIKAVRELDLSRRVWDNGWSPPAHPGDIREAHPYLERWTEGTEMKSPTDLAAKPFSFADLASAEKLPSTFYLPFQYANKMRPNWYWEQPCVINEYSYLWLNRDGSPTILTKPYYDAVLGANASPAQRRELYARNLAGVTEYWRAIRSCIAVLYPFGIAGSIRGGATSDNFVDPENLKHDGYFEKYVSDAFAALGVCAELWRTEFRINQWAGTQADFSVAVINDLDEAFDSYFTVKVMKGDSTISSVQQRYQVDRFAVSRTAIKIELPKVPGKYEVVTELYGRGNKVVRSYRTIEMIK